MTPEAGLVDIAPTNVVKPAEDRVLAAKVRPWVRYGARFVDNIVFGVSAGFLVGALFPAATALPAFVLNILTVGLWVPIETTLLSSLGTTPGKWLLNVKLTRRDGQPMDSATALRRSVSVWLRGMGLGIPLVVMVTLAISYGRLTNKGRTYWDEECDCDITHGEIGILRGGVAIAIIVIAVLLLAAAQASTRGQLL